MNIYELLTHLRSKGFELRAEGGRLICDAPKGAMTPKIQSVIAAHKTDILDFLLQARPDALRPFFHGQGANRLYCLHHPPKTAESKDLAVLLCYPGAHEFIRSHLPFGHLANMLSQEGYHVLRFDYFGTGDSAGQSWEGDARRWKEDITAMIQTLRTLTNGARIALVGLRLGAALAAEVAVMTDDIHGLVLWDPVVNGSQYLEELRCVHHDWFRFFKHYLEDCPADQGFQEILGFRYSPQLIKTIEEIDLFSHSLPQAAHLDLIVSEERAEYQRLHHRASQNGRKMDYSFVPEEGRWGTFTEWLLDPFLPKSILRQIKNSIKCMTS